MAFLQQEPHKIRSFPLFLISSQQNEEIDSDSVIEDLFAPRCFPCMFFHKVLEPLFIMHMNWREAAPQTAAVFGAKSEFTPNFSER